MGPTRLYAILMLLPVSFGVMVYAEKSPNAPPTGSLCNEACSFGRFMENVMRHINTRMNQTTTWTVTNAHPLVVLTPNGGSQNNEGNRKTFTWRQFGNGPPIPAVQNVITIRCTPRRLNPDRTKVGDQNVQAKCRVKPRRTKPTTTKRSSTTTVDADNEQQTPTTGKEPATPKAGNEQETPTTNKSPATPKAGNEQETTTTDKAPATPPKAGNAQDHDELEFKSGQNQNYPSYPGPVSRRADNIQQPGLSQVPSFKTWAMKSGTEIEGVCPGMQALECLAVMKKQPSNQAQGNIEKLNDPQLSKDSFKIKVSSNAGTKVELTQNQLDHLKALGASYCDKIKIDPSKKPRVVQVENAATKDLTNYVIVDEVGDMMIGCPYPNPSATTTPVKLRRVVTDGPPTLVPRRSLLEANGVAPHENMELMSQIRPELLVGNIPRSFGQWSADRPEPQRDYQIRMGTATYSTPAGPTYSDRPLLYNSGCCTTPQESTSWMKEEAQPEIQVSDYNQYKGNRQFFSPAHTNTNGPQSYWNEEVNSLISTKSQDNPYDGMNAYSTNNNREHNGFLTNPHNKHRHLLTARQLSIQEMQGFKQPPSPWSSRMRLRPRIMPKYPTGSSQHNAARGGIFPPRGSPRQTIPTCYYPNTMKRVPLPRGQPTWGTNTNPNSSGSYCSQGVYARPEGYPPFCKPVQAMAQPQLGYTLPLC